MPLEGVEEDSGKQIYCNSFRIKVLAVGVQRARLDHPSTMLVKEINEVKDLPERSFNQCGHIG